MSSEYERNYARFLPEDKNAKILDLGCGSGALLEWLQSKGYHNLVGVDKTKTATIQGVPIIEMDLFNYLQQTNRKNDRIIMRYVIEHTPKQRLNELITLLSDALKSDGTLVIETPNAGFILASSQRYADLEHEFLFTCETLEKLLEPYFTVEIMEELPAGWRTYLTRPFAGTLMVGYFWLLGIGKFDFKRSHAKDPRQYSAGMIAAARKRI